MGKQKIDGQTDLTILAKLNGSNQVQLFLLDNLAVIDGEDKLKDKFASDSKDSSVSIQVVSTDAAVTVTNNGGGGPSWDTGSLASNGVTLYYASATLGVPPKGSKAVKDSFTIQVGSYVADPTVVITRGGSGN